MCLPHLVLATLAALVYTAIWSFSLYFINRYRLLRSQYCVIKRFYITFTFHFQLPQWQCCRLQLLLQKLKVHFRIQVRWYWITVAFDHTGRWADQVDMYMRLALTHFFYLLSAVCFACRYIFRGRWRRPKWLQRCYYYYYCTCSPSPPSFHLNIIMMCTPLR